VHATDDEGRTLSDQQVLAHLNILLVAGHETTTTLSAWALYLLATMPDHQRRLRAELDARPELANGPPAAETLRSLKSLDYFIRETGRLYSPVLNVPRGVVKDFEFGGYRVPAGTPVRLALAAGHRLPHIFEQPATFDPERFAPPREEDKRHQYALVTFGGGPRICIGINFANIEVKALLAHMLRSFELEPVPGQHPVHAGHWTAIIPDGIQLRVRARTNQPTPATPA
jgi:cytochrome P450